MVLLGWDIIVVVVPLSYIYRQTETETEQAGKLSKLCLGHAIMQWECPP